MMNCIVHRGVLLSTLIDRNLVDKITETPVSISPKIIIILLKAVDSCTH